MSKDAGDEKTEGDGGNGSLLEIQPVGLVSSVSAAGKMDGVRIC
jgi:hypothetical protein